MYDRLAVKSLITPQKAVALSPFRSVQDMNISNDIAEEFYKTKSPDCRAFVPNAFLFEYLQMLGTIWNAGRIQGIREERKKRAERGQS